MLRRWRSREARHDIYMCGYKVLLLTRSNLIWIVKYMCLRCRLLKYVIIGINVVVYAVCKYARRLNPSRIHIKEVGFAKLQGVFCEFDVRRVQIGFAKDQGFFS